VNESIPAQVYSCQISIEEFSPFCTIFAKSINKKKIRTVMSTGLTVFRRFIHPMCRLVRKMQRVCTLPCNEDTWVMSVQ
jgi:hypothetical protein